MTAIILIIIAIILIVALGKTPMTIKSHPWNHFYDGIQFSTGEFYTRVMEGLNQRKIQGLKFGQEGFLEYHIFSAKREYLRITQAEYVFYICAAPFGTGTFVSWWLCIKDEKFINKIPILSKMAGKDRTNKTFYQMDTESMYQSVVHHTVVAVADAITEEKGLRLSELDRQFIQGK